MSSTRSFALAASAAVLFLASCKGAEQVCNPTDPLCGGGGGGIDTIVVASAIDTVIANGRTAQMTAVARDAGGNALSMVPAFTSLNTGVATVDLTTGLVTAVAPGQATIRVSQATNSVVGTLRIHVVNANLPLVTAMVTDSMAVRLRVALSATPQTAIATGITTCVPNVASGNLLALDACLTALTAVSGGTDGNDNALLGVLDLFFNFARRALNL